MKDVFLIYIFFCFYIVLDATEDEDTQDTWIDYGNNNLKLNVPTSNCWMTLNSAQQFKILDEIDARYAKIREEVQESLKENDFDFAMIEGFKRERGVALREVYSHHHNTWMIPSGLNLGGFCMLRAPGSVLFFHRMKLRNNTYFRVDYVHNDLSNMVVRMHLSLNDLHLMGAYERSLTDRDPAVLVYAPTFGQVEFLMKDVKYKMEGRYRLIKNRLLIELISSEIIINDILMTYITKAIESAPLKVQKKHLGSFIDRMKTDLDQWLKDYFNDYMIYADMDGIPHMDELSKYDKEKGRALEEFADNSIYAIGTRIRLLNAANIHLPTFTFKSIHNLQVKLYDGILYGLDSMYRRSVATGYNQKGVRKIDCVVGFSNLKVVYKYEAVLRTGVPPLSGTMTLSANELSAHLALAMVADPETVDLDLEFLDQMKPESLTVEGAANVMISNFKHLLEHQIVAIMSNTLLHGVIMLKSLPRCEPFLPGTIQVNKNAIFKKDKEGSDIDLFSDFHASATFESWEFSKESGQVIRESNRSNKKKNETEVKKFIRKSKKVRRRSKTSTHGNN